jgi:hypothetical protein
MNLIIPAGFVGTLTIHSHPLFVVNAESSAKDQQPPPAPSVEPPKPFTQAGRNNIYVAALGLATALMTLRHDRPTESQFLEYARAIYDNALLMGKGENPPAEEAIAEGLHRITASVKTTGTSSPAVSQSGELEWIRRSLAMLVTEKAKPSVRVTAKKAIIDLPDAGHWSKPLREFTNQTVLLNTVRHLSAKRWANADLLGELVTGVCRAKGWALYDFDPKLHQGEG